MLTQNDQLYPYLDHPLQKSAAEKGIQIKMAAHYLDFVQQDKIVRISLKHFVYGPDIISSYAYYFGAVESVTFNSYKLVDYSAPKYHDVAGFDLMPVYFPSFAEPIHTTRQYLEFAQIKPGDAVIDLGAYSGLTSILFKELTGKSGRVVAVDADEQNIFAIRKNFEMYKTITRNEIDLFRGAIWNHNDGLDFSSEGNMGSAASETVGRNRGNNMPVRSFTLSSLADMAKLDAVDFIKCDVEGAEAVIFGDRKFFERFLPRIIVETHVVGNQETTEKCVADLERCGYVCKRVKQPEVTLPLIECYPPGNG